MKGAMYVPDSQKGIFANAAAWVLATLVLVLLIAVAIAGIRWVTAEPRGQLAAREQIQSAGSRIAAYNHFFDLCAAVQAQEAALAAQYAALSGAVGDERERLRANVAGLTAQRARSIAQYNADARKSYTIGQFRASGLPFELPATTYREGSTTSCVA